MSGAPGQPAPPTGDQSGEEVRLHDSCMYLHVLYNNILREICVPLK